MHKSHSIMLYLNLDIIQYSQELSRERPTEKHNFRSLLSLFTRIIQYYSVILRLSYYYQNSTTLTTQYTTTKHNTSPHNTSLYSFVYLSCLSPIYLTQYIIHLPYYKITSFTLRHTIHSTKFPFTHMCMYAHGSTRGHSMAPHTLRTAITRQTQRTHTCYFMYKLPRTFLRIYMTSYINLSPTYKKNKVQTMTETDKLKDYYKFRQQQSSQLVQLARANYIIMAHMIPTPYIPT